MLPLVLSLVALDIPDTPVAATRQQRSSHARKSLCATPREVLRSLFESRDVLTAAVVVSLVPEINTSLFFYLLSAHATPKEMSLVDVSGSMASLLTLLLYNTCRPSHSAPSSRALCSTRWRRSWAASWPTTPCRGCCRGPPSKRCAVGRRQRAGAHADHHGAGQDGGEFRARSHRVQPGALRAQPGVRRIGERGRGRNAPAACHQGRR